MIITIFDTNVLVSAFLFNGSKPETALRKVRFLGKFITSFETINELINTLNKDKFDKYLDVNRRILLINDYIESADEIDITQSFSICRDPKDNKFLDLAYSGNADYLITGDKDLLVLNPFNRTKIVTPEEFLEIFS
jgi:putative PIN family toxin of toxin-antitoxin system